MVTTMTQKRGDSVHDEKSIWASMSILTLSGIMLAIGVVWRIVDQFVLGLGDTWMNILPSKLFPFLIILGFFWKYRRDEIASVLGLSKNQLKAQIAAGLVIGFLISVLIDFGGTIFYGLVIDPTYPLELHIINQELLGYLFLFFLTNAFLEEILFRGLIQNSLKTRYSPKIAIMVSAIIFGVWHAGWPLLNASPGESVVTTVAMMVFFTTILGLLFGIYYERFSSGKSLMGLIVAHTIFNFANECFKIGPEPTMQGPDLGFANPGVMVVSMLFFLLVFSILFYVFWRYKIEQAAALWNRTSMRVRNTIPGLSKKETAEQDNSFEV
ncbi:CPBP family intramembrane metalloprotease [Candidatus Thorarchaeota archaeon]|nr:CPBP family intramembrane metalloprotease [Candidatus Thorarchaeota archaeon]TFG97983.1 MAG: CPBP family intramembrane metalloprotease [Candidatus Thorarchaeota archaeon]